MDSNLASKNFHETLPFETLINYLPFDCWAVNREMVYVFQNNKSIENWENAIDKTVNDLECAKK